MADYVKFKVPKELLDRQMQMVEKIAKAGKIRIGNNEVTKAIERQKAKLVVMAEDVQPAEIMMHLPLLCEEKRVPYSYAPTKSELGKKAGIEVGTSAIAIVEEGSDKKDFDDLVKKLSDAKK